MRRVFLAVLILGGLTGMTAFAATAAPSATGVHVSPAQSLVTHVDYYDHHHRWHHRHWEHDHWRYWN